MIEIPLQEIRTLKGSLVGSVRDAAVVYLAIVLTCLGLVRTEGCTYLVDLNRVVLVMDMGIMPAQEDSPVPYYLGSELQDFIGTYLDAYKEKGSLGTGVYLCMDALMYFCKPIEVTPTEEPYWGYIGSLLVVFTWGVRLYLTMAGLLGNLPVSEEDIPYLHGICRCTEHIREDLKRVVGEYPTRYGVCIDRSR